MLKWYLKYGKNVELKRQLDELRTKCDLNSDNNPFMEEKLKGILPPVTVILNFEFETKRKYYYDSHQALFTDYEQGQRPLINDEQLVNDPLMPLFHVLAHRRAILDHLTSHVVCFCDEFEPLPKPMDFWEAINSLNDNDMAELSENPDFTTFSTSTSRVYSERKKKKARLLRTILRSQENAEESED